MADPSRNFKRFWLPVYGYAALIFILSSIPKPDHPPMIANLDKLIHLVEYAILGYLLARAARNSSQEGLRIHFRIFAVCVGLAYGISDEFHQSFVPGRVVDHFDIVADTLGAYIGQMFLRG